MSLRERDTLFVGMENIYVSLEEVETPVKDSPLPRIVLAHFTDKTHFLKWVI